MTIWCYTTDPAKRWEYCDPIAPDCQWNGPTSSIKANGYCALMKDKEVGMKQGIYTVKDCDKACVDHGPDCKEFMLGRSDSSKYG